MSQNWFAARDIVTTTLPLGIVPETAWLLTGIAVAPDGAPGELTLKAWPPRRTEVLAEIATPRAATGMEVMLPESAAVVDARNGSSGGRSSLLTKPPRIVNPALKS